MRFFRTPLSMLFPALLAPVAQAQIPPNSFKHIIIIVQENRTPDNLFGYWATTPCTGNGGGFAGADLQNGGNSVVGGAICAVPQPMNSGTGTFQDPGHQFEDWTADYDLQNSVGKMDGFCHTISPVTHQVTYVACPNPNTPSPYSYIQQPDVAPYFSIATTYGFANYMFQTNEGPSFPAHQFLFTGTSAPVAPNDPSGYYWDFVRDNPPDSSEFDTSGCPYNAGGGYPPAPWIHPDRTILPSPVTYECYPHDSLVTGSICSNGVCDKISSWTYYSPLPNGIIWNAPEAIPEVCYSMNSTDSQGTPCGGTEWNNHMKFYSTMGDAPIFQDITSCNLAKISWVIPDLAWSDHPFSNVTGAALGPSWVADIVNAIGNNYLGGRCDYWGTHSGSVLSVEPTAIFIVWDDWGGFYDHLKPQVLTGSPNGNSWNCPAPATNNWGCGYTYGFRVPFMVVSEFTGTKSGANYTGYISGPCGVAGQPSCPNTTAKYQHDFGSILAFTEHNFGLSNVDQSGHNGYADYNAPDWSADHITHVPLSDFFALWTSNSSVGRPFILVPSSYGPSFFESYYATHAATPTGPDTD
jgi:phospholipase C